MIFDQKIPKEYLAGAECFTAASAALDLATSDEFEAIYDIPILRGYGATEFLDAVTSFRLDDYRKVGREKRGSVGRALPGVSLRVVDPETGEALPPGSEGCWKSSRSAAPAGSPRADAERPAKRLQAGASTPSFLDASRELLGCRTYAFFPACCRRCLATGPAPSWAHSSFATTAR
jgi:AMP-binding enzyme